MNLIQSGMTPEKGSAAKGRIPILDTLRALAALLVVLYHIWQISWIDYTALLHSPVSLIFVPGMGFFGVDLFFFVSAFCLTLPYARHWLADSAAPTLKHYIGRRVAKILPSYWLAILVVVLFFPDPTMAKERLPFNLWTHLFFIHNWFFESTNTFIGVLWSLAVEVQFYVLFPLILIGFRRAPHLVIFAMVSVALVWRGLCTQQFLFDRDEVLYIHHDAQLPARLDMFAAGMLAAYLFVRLRSNPTVIRLQPLFAVLTLVIIGVVVYQMWWWYEITRSAMILSIAVMQGRLPLAVTFLALGLFGALSSRPFQNVVGNRVMVFISTISYNLYLWHQLVAVWLKDHHIPNPVTEDPHDDPQWMFVYTLFAWTASIVVATVITWVWEMPFLRGLPWKRLSAKKK